MRAGSQGPIVGTSAANVSLLGSIWNGWLSHTSNVRIPANTFDERIRARRSRVGSGIFLGLIVITLTLLILERLTTSDMPTFYALLVALVGLSLGCVLNRYDQVELSGALVALVIDAAIFGAVLSAPDGKLDTDYLGSYYLMALILGVVAILMPTWGLLAATVVNCVLIAVDFLVLQGYTPALAQQLTADGYFFEIGRPIVLNIGIAFALYILARTLLGEGRRADRAEDLALLEERELERQRVLEAEVRELLAVHVQLANGNFNARVSQLSNPLLWQIGASLNNLMNRLARLGQADFAYQRTQQETMRLAEALQMLLEGRIPVWPAPSGTPADAVLALLQNLIARLAAGDQQLLRQLGQGMSYGGGSTRDALPGQPFGGQAGSRSPMPPSLPGFGPGQRSAGEGAGGYGTGDLPPSWRAPQLQAPQAPAPGSAAAFGAPRNPEAAPFDASQADAEAQLPPWLRSPAPPPNPWTSEAPDTGTYPDQNAYSPFPQADSYGIRGQDGASGAWPDPYTDNQQR